MGRKILVASLLALLSISLTKPDTVYLKNGNILRGEIRSFENGRFTLSVAGSRGGERSELMINVTDVARIRFGLEGAAPVLKEVTRSLDVVSTQPVSSTGVQVRQRDRVRLEARGEIFVDRTRRTGPNGIPGSAPERPFPRDNWGALYAMVGNYPGEALVVGTRKEFTARRDGEIFLGINDGFLANNSGSYQVTITTWEPEEEGTGIQGRRRESGASAAEMVEERIEVRADLGWTDTGIQTREGERINLEASGTITLAPGKSTGPDGVSPGILGAIFGTLPVPDAKQGALIGQIRGEQNSDVFVIGSRSEVVAPIAGTLFLGVNDDSLSNNSGSYVVAVKHTRPGRRL